MYEVAIALNYLKRLPRSTENCFDIRITSSDESEYAFVSGDAESFELGLGGTTESGREIANQPEGFFSRTQHGDSEGHGGDVYRWIEAATKLLWSGGRLRANPFSDEVEWDDGESEKYWELMQ